MSKSPGKKVSPPTNTKRIHNPVTNTYYKVRVKNTSAGRKGTIIGKWSPKK